MNVRQEQLGKSGRRSKIPLREQGTLLSTITYSSLHSMSTLHQQLQYATPTPAMSILPANP